MKARALLSFPFVLLSLALVACSKPGSHSADAIEHTTQAAQLRDLRLQLTQAVTKNELQYIHDNMLYFRGVLRSIARNLEGEKKEEVERALQDLERMAIDNPAKPGEIVRGEADLQKLIDRLDELEKRLQAKQ